MTSDIEIRKAEALKALKNINSPMAPGQTNLDIVLEIKDFLLHYFFLEELLQPSPIVADDEVDDNPGTLLGNINHVRDYLIIGSKQAGLTPKSCAVLLGWIDIARDKAAQQPRQDLVHALTRASKQFRFLSDEPFAEMCKDAVKECGDGWRTMESAPRDGTRILLCVDGNELGYKKGSQARVIGYYAPKFTLLAHEDCDPEKYPSWFEYNEADGVYYSLPDFYADTFENQYGDEISKLVKPTHWQPLPAPPKEK